MLNLRLLFLHQNSSALVSIVLTTIPLFVGSFLELGEVDLLVIFVRFLGPAEGKTSSPCYFGSQISIYLRTLSLLLSLFCTIVAAWALFANIWSILEASTEGLSEAAAIRVAYHLSASQPVKAKKAAEKALFWSTVESLIITSVLLLAGRSIVINLTKDITLQHLLDALIPIAALANISMSFAQATWSLLGAQGRFSLATFVILVCRWCVTMPLALIFIFALQYHEISEAGAVAIGSATSACVLSYFLFSCDWNEVAQDLVLQGILSSDDDDDFDFSFGDDDDDYDDDDSSSDESSFGLGEPIANDKMSKQKSKSFDEDLQFVEPLPPPAPTITTRTETNTGSGLNSAGTISGMGGVGSGVAGSHSGVGSGTHHHDVEHLNASHR